jgi:hypothetical protein
MSVRFISEGTLATARGTDSPVVSPEGAALQSFLL